MQEQEVELCVGDTFQIGDCLVTVVDIDGEDVTFRIQDDSDTVCLTGGDGHRVTRPR